MCRTLSCTSVPTVDKLVAGLCLERLDGPGHSTVSELLNWFPVSLESPFHTSHTCLQCPERPHSDFRLFMCFSSSQECPASFFEPTPTPPFILQHSALVSLPVSPSLAPSSFNLHWLCLLCAVGVSSASSRGMYYARRIMALTLMVSSSPDVRLGVNGDCVSYLWSLVCSTCSGNAS